MLVQNNYLFWNKYLHDVADQIENLIDTKEKILTDFHIHSDYSADGKQSLEEIIKRAKELKIDIIAVTDHDSIKVYDDLFQMLKQGNYDGPIIVPGVEWTCENHEYGSQCHILQLMINPKEKEILKNIKHNENASWTRAHKQFVRISENKSLQYFFNKYNIDCSENKFKRYLATLRRPIPEYTTLLDYIMSLLKEKNITTWDVFEKLEDYNLEDMCEERRNLKAKRYDVLRTKYKDREDAPFSTRFLLSLLAVKGVDDEYFPEYESCGSLSVNNFGELKIEEINNRHLTIFAHPNENRLPFMNKAFKLNPNISGMEMNRQSIYSDDKLFYDKAKEINAITILGSDSHAKDSPWFDDINFYSADKVQLRRFVNKAREYFVIGLDRKNAKLKEYSIDWKNLYNDEKEKIVGLIGSNILGIEHVGSTSIPGLKAKPIIDIAVAVDSLDNVIENKISVGEEKVSIKDILVNNGYNFRDDGGVKGEYLFSLGDENLRTHYIHVVPKTGKRWNDYMDFKDYLLVHPNKVEEYKNLKEELATKYADDRKMYTSSKNDFITNVLEEARKN